MARFSKLFLGGILGAGLALLLAPKTGRELRGMLMGRMRPALPPAAEEYPPAPEAMPAADLQTRIEETRRQIEAQLARTAPPETVTVVEAESVTAAVEAAPAEAEEAKAVEVPAEAEEAAVEEAVEEEIVEEETAVEEAAGEEAIEAEPAVAAEEAAVAEEEAAAETAAAGGEADEFPTLKTPATGEPTLEEPPAETAEEAGEEAAEAEPSRPEPSRFDQDEMRRRIDETRARLKAKAFDAMVSGETFIEPEEGRQAEGSEQSGSYGLEEDVEKQIDEELREEP